MNHVCCCGARNLYLNMAMNTINWFQLPKQSAVQNNISTSFGPPNHGCRGYTTSKYIKLKIIILWLYQLLLKFGFFFQKLSLLFGGILLLEYRKLSPPSSATVGEECDCHKQERRQQLHPSFHGGSALVGKGRAKQVWHLKLRYFLLYLQ